MQDRYVGDVGDFAKFGLLRRLAEVGRRKLRLGVVWCAFPDESHNGDGRHVAYLRNETFAALDPDLHARLRGLVDGRRRTMRDVEVSGILPKRTLFYREPCSGLAGNAGTVGLRRQAHRTAWLAGALSATEAADLVFFDPDNGIATPLTPRLGPKSGKFIFKDELMPFWGRGQSLVIYHHLNRTCTAEIQTIRLEADLAGTFPGAPRVIPLLFRRGSCRHFWIVGQPSHAATLGKAAEAFLASGWSTHFSPLARLLQSSTRSAGLVPSQSTRTPSGPSTTCSIKSRTTGRNSPRRAAGSK